MTGSKPLICTPVNKYLAMLKTEGASTSRMIANPFEVAKAYVLASAEGKLSKYLPYTVSYDLPADNPAYCPQGWELDHWRSWLTGPLFANDPQLFRKLVEPLDFSKPFDKEAVDAIRAQFAPKKRAEIAIDAAQVEEESRDA